jgi:hypothetical protein
MVAQRPQHAARIALDPRVLAAPSSASNSP